MAKRLRFYIEIFFTGIIFSLLAAGCSLFGNPEDLRPKMGVKEEHYTVVPGNSLDAKLDWLEENAESGGRYEILLETDEDIYPRILSYSEKTNIKIRLKGTGGECVISLSSFWGTLFTVEEGVTLILDDKLTLKGSGDMGSLEGNISPLLIVNSRASLIMNKGAKIIDNINVGSSGGAVYVDGGSFTLNGGEISGNYNYSLAGAGVYVASGVFTMNGGIISENGKTILDTHSGSESKHGGGVYLENGVYTLNGGEVSENIGSGVYVEDGKFYMKGGKISGNSNTRNSSTTTSGYGGGVYVARGAFTMSGGEISGNNSGYGGGVYISKGIFNKTGGTIYGYIGDYDKKSNIAHAHNYYGAEIKILGHAVYASGDEINLKKDFTAGPEIKMFYDGTGTTPVWNGSWENIVVPGDNGESFEDKLNWIKNHAVNGGGYLIYIDEDEYCGNQILSYNGLNISIRLEATRGQLFLNSNGPMFSINSGVVLILSKITLVGSTSSSSSRRSLIEVNKGGTLQMKYEPKDGVIILNNYSENGGGISVNGGTFVMDGGYITGNNARYGGGVLVNSGTFIMREGNIWGNSAIIHDGGGVLVNGGSFYMTGGNIYDNYTYDNGGGVSVKGGSFVLEGGNIESNEANKGGGVSVEGGSFTMNYGSIKSNEAYHGGGVYVSGGSFSYLGGKIDGSESSLSNTAQYDHGNAVYAVKGYVVKGKNSSAQNYDHIWFNATTNPPSYSEDGWDF